MPEPYYRDDHCTIYLGDCLDLIDTLDFDVVVTDPPYGINLDTDYTALTGSRDWNEGRGRSKRHERVAGDDVPFDPSPLLRWPAAMFGSNHWAQRAPAGATWHVWDKVAGLAANGVFADAEFWLTTWPSGPTRIFRHQWAGFLRGPGKDQHHHHPTQKPETLMRHIIGEDRTPDGTILDPFMGSGTTLRAAKDLGRKAIGVEIDERYCEIAARRLGQEVLAFE